MGRNANCIGEEKALPKAYFFSSEEALRSVKELREVFLQKAHLKAQKKIKLFNSNNGSNCS